MSSISFTGLASGIDSSALIKSLLDSARRSRISPLEARIAALTDTNSSLDELASLLGKLNTSVQKFRSINGSALAKSATSSDEAVLTVGAANGSANGSYSVAVTNLARTGTLSLDDRFSSSSQVINSAINNGASATDRTVSITVGTGGSQEVVNIELTNTTTVDGFISQFNSTSSFAEASLVNVGTSSSPSYAIVISSAQQGTERGSLALSVGTEVSSAGAGAFATSTLEQATDATFSVSGISGNIVRSSNRVTDVIGGLTLDLVSLGNSTVTVSDDTSSTADSIEEFISAYNDVAKFIKQENGITRSEEGAEVTNIFGPLATTRVDDNLLFALRSSLSQTRTSGGTVNVLADLGITTERDGTLKFDRTVFTKALTQNPRAVQELTASLGETLGAVDGTIAQYTRFNGLIDAEQNSRLSQISTLNNQMGRIEDYLAREEQMLTARYARLESLVGKLNAQEQSLGGLSR